MLDLIVIVLSGLVLWKSGSSGAARADGRLRVGPPRALLRHGSDRRLRRRAPRDGGPGAPHAPHHDPRSRGQSLIENLQSPHPERHRRRRRAARSPHADLEEARRALAPRVPASLAHPRRLSLLTGCSISDNAQVEAAPHEDLAPQRQGCRA
ncbi:hypothetical protein DdX_21659 [Ditylenchus destructor]|uniref:Uncharacterized protein n=1 Tax=Ditylenchus destructor TaxID=166010 RepID=A0AAD4MEN9_9BILA|nr:hypothetical protein DdX_21659 [Ditylenchus destructor]